MLFPAPGTGRGAVVAVLLGAVAVACMLGQHMRARDALLGKGDEWIAKEDSMALDVADEMAKRFVPRSAPAPSRERTLPAAPPGVDCRRLTQRLAARCVSPAPGRSSGASRTWCRSAAGDGRRTVGSAEACRSCRRRARR